MDEKLSNAVGQGLEKGGSFRGKSKDSLLLRGSKAPSEKFNPHREVGVEGEPESLV